MRAAAILVVSSFSLFLLRDDDTVFCRGARFRRVGRIFQPAAVDATAEPTSEFSPYTHTLVQYLSSSTCMGENYVCLQLRLDRMTTNKPPSDVHEGKSICNKLESLPEDDEEIFHLNSCYAPAEGCGPFVCDECSARNPSPPFTLGECHGENMVGGVSSSKKLLEGDITTLGLKCAARQVDIGLARWCDRWPDKGPIEKGLKTVVPAPRMVEEGKENRATIVSLGKGQCLDATGAKLDGYYSKGAKTAKECQELLGELKGVEGVRGAQLHAGWTCHIRVDDGFDPREHSISTGWAGGLWTAGKGKGPVVKADGSEHWQCWALQF